MATDEETPPPYRLTTSEDEAEQLCPGVAQARRAFMLTVDALKRSGESPAAVLSGLMSAMCVVCDAVEMDLEGRRAIADGLRLALLTNAASAEGPAN